MPFIGTISLPGDKSISHRALMLSALTQGTSHITNLAGNADVSATRECLEALGAVFNNPEPNHYVCDGLNNKNGLLNAPNTTLNAKNSGTTMRLLCGILASQNFSSHITGDDSLNKRPMARIITPLSLMNATITGTQTESQLCPPLHIHPTTKGIQGIDYSLPIASAQVKSAILLAGLFAKNQTVIHEPQPSRDHTERMLNVAGVAISRENNTIILEGNQIESLTPQQWHVPGDFSSAAFWIVGALCTPKSQISLNNVSLNPLRTGLLSVLKPLAPNNIQITNERIQCGEPVGDLRITAPDTPLKGDIVVDEALLPSLIDEIPILSVLVACSACRFTLTGAQELRHKESDRIHALVTLFNILGVAINEQPDGFTITGTHNGDALIPPTHALPTYGDHRIAMALCIMNAITQPQSTWALETPECIAVSYPQFNTVLKQLSTPSM